MTAPILYIGLFIPFAFYLGSAFFFEGKQTGKSFEESYNPSFRWRENCILYGDWSKEVNKYLEKYIAWWLNEIGTIFFNHYSF